MTDSFLRTSYLTILMTFGWTLFLSFSFSSNSPFAFDHSSLFLCISCIPPIVHLKLCDNFLFYFIHNLVYFFFFYLLSCCCFAILSSVCQHSPLPTVSLTVLSFYNLQYQKECFWVFSQNSSTFFSFFCKTFNHVSLLLKLEFVTIFCFIWSIIFSLILDNAFELISLCGGVRGPEHIFFFMSIQSHFPFNPPSSLHGNLSPVVPGHLVVTLC